MKDLSPQFAFMFGIFCVCLIYYVGLAVYLFLLSRRHRAAHDFRKQEK